jgi:hypothetical protein
MNLIFPAVFFATLYYLFRYLGVGDRYSRSLLFTYIWGYFLIVLAAAGGATWL